MTEGVALVIPEVNPEAMKGMRYGQGGIIANPNCSTIIALMAVTPLHRAAKVTHIQEQVKLDGATLRLHLHAVLACHAEQGSPVKAISAVLCCAVLCCAVLSKSNFVGGGKVKSVEGSMYQAADTAGQAV